MSKILCVLDLRPDGYYSLERLPSIRRVLTEHEVSYLDIYSFESQFGVFKYPDKSNKKFVEYVKNNEFKTILTSSEWLGFVSIETIQELKKNDVVIASVLGDDENNYLINVNYLGVFTVPIAYQQKEYNGYSKINPNTEKLLVSTSMYNTDKYLGVEKVHDVIFIGKAYGNRPELLKYLYDNGINVIVYGGKKWSEYFDDDVYKGYISNDNYHNEISKSKITLGLLESPKNPEILHVNAKAFDAAKTGTALVVTRYKRFFDDYKLTENTDFLAYSTKEELLSNIKRLLLDNNLREMIAKSLRDKIKSNYDYDKLYDVLLANILDVNQSISPVVKAKVLYVEPGHSIDDKNVDDFDYVIFKGKGVVYSTAIEDVLSAYVSSNEYVKLDSMAYGRVARKVFQYVDLPSLAIPVNKLKELPKTKGIMNIEKCQQTYIPLNRYKYFDSYICLLIFVRLIYKRLLK